MRSIPINLGSPQEAFAPALTPKPKESEISAVLYGEGKRINDVRSTNKKANSKFLMQWDALIDLFANILEKNLGIDINMMKSGDPTYNSISERLKKGVKDSIADKESGLLPNQADAVFLDLKSTLEELCYFFLKSDAKPEQAKGILKDLEKELDACGPGLFQHLQSARDALYKKEGLKFWLADLRSMIVRQYADRAAQTVMHVGDRVHVLSAFKQYAQNNNWELTSRNEVRDNFIQGIVDSKWYPALHQHFQREYQAQAIGHIAECTKDFFIIEFKKLATDGKLSLEKMDGFVKVAQPIFNDMRLQINDFLTVSEDKDGNDIYSLNEHALDQLYVRTAFALCDDVENNLVDKKYLFSIDPDKKISFFCDVENKKIFCRVTFFDRGETTSDFFEYQLESDNNYSHESLSQACIENLLKEESIHSSARDLLVDLLFSSGVASIAKLKEMISGENYSVENKLKILNHKLLTTENHSFYHDAARILESLFSSLPEDGLDEAAYIKFASNSFASESLLEKIVSRPGIPASVLVIIAKKLDYSNSFKKYGNIASHPSCNDAVRLALIVNNAEYKPIDPRKKILFEKFARETQSADVLSAIIFDPLFSRNSDLARLVSENSAFEKMSPIDRGYFNNDYSISALEYLEKTSTISTDLMRLTESEAVLHAALSNPHISMDAKLAAVKNKVITANLLLLVAKSKTTPEIGSEIIGNPSATSEVLLEIAKRQHNDQDFYDRIVEHRNCTDSVLLCVIENGDFRVDFLKKYFDSKDLLISTKAFLRVLSKHEMNIADPHGFAVHHTFATQLNEKIDNEKWFSSKISSLAEHATDQQSRFLLWKTINKYNYNNIIIEKFIVGLSKNKSLSTEFLMTLAESSNNKILFFAATHPLCDNSIRLKIARNSSADLSVLSRLNQDTDDTAISDAIASHPNCADELMAGIVTHRKLSEPVLGKIIKTTSQHIIAGVALEAAGLSQKELVRKNQKLKARFAAIGFIDAYAKKRGSLCPVEKKYKPTFFVKRFFDTKLSEEKFIHAIKLKETIVNCKNNCEAIDAILAAQRWNSDKQKGKLGDGKYHKALTRALLEFEKPSLKEIVDHIIKTHLKSRADLIPEVKQAQTLVALQALLNKNNCSGALRFVNAIVEADVKKKRGSTLHFGSRVEGNSPHR